jgi:hypothetical protein
MYGMDKKKKKRDGMSMGGKKERPMYMEGGKAHSGAQPMYGNTVETAMPKGGAN